jgi:hypothetical protein
MQAAVAEGNAFVRTSPRSESVFDPFLFISLSLSPVGRSFFILFRKQQIAESDA